MPFLESTIPQLSTYENKSGKYINLALQKSHNTLLYNSLYLRQISNNEQVVKKIHKFASIYKFLGGIIASCHISL